MGFLGSHRIEELKSKLITDLSILGKHYKARKKDSMTLSVDHNLAEDFVQDGWEIAEVLKTKTWVTKPKSHDKKFEDDIWCQLYDLGYRCMNFDDQFHLPFGKEEAQKKQIDVVAINEETIILVECKSSEKPKKAPSYKDEFEGLGVRLSGFRKTFAQIFGEDRKLKYVFATRNLRIDKESIDLERLAKTNSLYYGENIFKYVNNLIKHYRNAAHYQFLGLLFRNQLISSEKIEIPALEGNMGKKKYYMFSIEPELLLKMGFVLHRTRTNEEDMPNYQRLLKPSRLSGIAKFINEGGYFPNSIIVNFSQKKQKLQFQASSKSKSSVARHGILKIPNAYAIAYIIDGQHRLYGYAYSEFRKSNTIPVVAFKDLEPKEQLEIFMNINQNQKAVSPSLRLMLMEDMYWDAPRADSRIGALRSAIIRELAEDENSPLHGKIEIGADPAILSAKPFEKAIKDSGLLPKARGNKYEPESITTTLYDINNQDHNQEMNRAKRRVVQFVCCCYEFLESNFPDVYEREQYFVISNRGTYGIISLIGSLNRHVMQRGEVSTKSTGAQRLSAIQKYVVALMEDLRSVSQEDEEKLLSSFGSGADVGWLRFFQSIIHLRFREYNPPELIDWKERQDDELQAEGRSYGVAIEKHMKSVVLKNMKLLYGKNWELEINTIKTECQKRANLENERYYREGIDKSVDWTEMFTIMDYKSIIDKHWEKKPTDETEFLTFEHYFSIDIGIGKRKKEVMKWISHFNSYRNLWAHEGTKEKRLNREEVGFLKMIYDKIGLA